MHVALALLIFLGFLSSQVTMKKEPVETINLQTAGPGSTKIRENVIPLSEIQSRAIIKQMYDYSCGSAALATLLNAQLGENFSEKQVIKGMLQYGDRQKIEQRRAFSLLDMKKFVNKLGYEGAGYEAAIEDLRTLERPGIVPIEIFEYRHFAVFRGIYKDHVFLADPWRGNISFPLKEFENRWYQNVIFIVHPDGAKEFTTLRLSEEDLRFIDEDLALKMIVDPTAVPQATFDRKVDNVPGTYQHYKR